MRKEPASCVDDGRATVPKQRISAAFIHVPGFVKVAVFIPVA